MNPANVPESFHSSAPTVTFPAGTFRVGDAFVFTANVAREPVAVGRDVTVSTTVRIVEGPATSTVAGAPTPPSLRVEGPPGGVVAASSRVALRARVYDCAGDEGTCGVTWSCVEGDLTDPTALAAAVETGLENHILAVKPDALAPGTRYAFRASAGGSAAGLVADVVFDVNAPPRGGRVVAEFTASRADQPVADADADAVAALGFARVTIRASDWGDDAARALLVRILRRGRGRIARAARAHDLVQRRGRVASFGNARDSRARRGRARRGDFRRATVTVAPAPAPSPPPPPSPHPPPYTGTRSSGTVPPPPARRRRLLTASASASASAYDVAEALDYLEVLLRPATTTSDHARAAQAAKAYADRYAATTPGVVVPDCAGLDPIAEHHAEVARAIRDARDATARTTPGVTMTLCAAAALTGDPTTITASTMANLGATFAAEAAAATAPDLDAVTIAPEGVRCAATLASNLLAAVEAGARRRRASGESTATALAAAFDLALTSAARALVPGGAHIRPTPRTSPRRWAPRNRPPRWGSPSRSPRRR